MATRRTLNQLLADTLLVLAVVLALSVNGWG